jgi:hypothetical protein
LNSDTYTTCVTARGANLVFEGSKLEKDREDVLKISKSFGSNGCILRGSNESFEDDLECSFLAMKTPSIFN